MKDQVNSTAPRQPHNPVPLSQAEAEVFKKHQWSSVGFFGPLNVIANGLGDTVGIAPIMPVSGADWTEKTSNQFDKASPICAQAMLIRLWFETKGESKRFLVELPAFFATRALKMRGAWYGLEVGADLLELQIAMIDFAKERGLHAFDDEDVSKRLREPPTHATA